MKRSASEIVCQTMVFVRLTVAFKTLTADPSYTVLRFLTIVEFSMVMTPPPVQMAAPESKPSKERFLLNTQFVRLTVVLAPKNTARPPPCRARFRLNVTFVKLAVIG